jgi:hypothetical protein
MTADAFWVVVVTASPVIILIPVAIAHYRREQLLRTSGTYSAGRILELSRTDDGVGNISYWAKVEYKCYDGSLYTDKVLVRNARDYRVGQWVNLTYVPGRSIVRVDSLSSG